MKITVIGYPTDADWLEVKRRALVTVGLRPVTPPSVEWRHEMLVQRHSPIRYLRVSVLLEDIPYWLSTEFSRHVHAQPYIKSQRNDRRRAAEPQDDRSTRPQGAPVNMIWDFNGESLLIAANKRLCRMATPEAQQAMGEIVKQVCERCPEFKGVLVPMCRFHGGICHEANGCGLCLYDGMENDNE